MSHAFRLIVFDFDGTLVDSQRLILAGMKLSFAAHGLPVPAPELVRRVIGLRLDVAVARLLPDPGDTDRVERVAASYRDAFSQLHQQSEYQTPLFPGVADGLRELDTHDVCLGIATGKGRRGLMASLERHDIRKHFVTLQTTDGSPSKPHPDLLLRAMAVVGAEPAATVMIGDTTYDMEMAGNAKTAAIGVAWGYHGTAELQASGAVRVVERFADIPAALTSATEAQPCG